MIVYRRRVLERDITQGVNEEIVRTLTVPTSWATDPPTNAEVKVYDKTDDYADVTSTTVSGSATVDGQVITLPAIKSLVRDHHYHVEVRFTGSGNKLSAWFEIICRR